MPLLVEIKASCEDHGTIREILKSAGGICKGTDHQIDTYFKVPAGRLKLRQGNIENHLIQYNRPNQKEAKTSEVLLYKPTTESEKLKATLAASCGILAVVDKTREIWFVENVKFHLDHVDQLGQFVEVEAIDEDGSISEDKLRRQCDFWVDKLNISAGDLLTSSYSDMLLEKA